MTEQAYLSRDAYLALGVRQSIYAPDVRGAVYDLFEKYLRFLDEQGWFDPNILSHSWMARVAPRYDFVVVDEVQDLNEQADSVWVVTIEDAASGNVYLTVGAVTTAEFAFNSDASVAALKGAADFEPLAVAFKRVGNIIKGGVDNEVTNGNLVICRIGYTG